MRLGPRNAAQGGFEESLAEDSEEYGNLVRIAPHLAAICPEALFEAGLRVLLDGIGRQLEESAPRRGFLRPESPPTGRW